MTTKGFDMQMTIRMPEEYKARIEELSSRTGLKKSDIARLAIKKYLEDFFDALDQEDRPFDRCKDLIGVVGSGIPDLGTNHRRHLLSRIQEKKE
jgi:hypothetical protein